MCSCARRNRNQHSYVWLCLESSWKETGTCKFIIVLKRGMSIGIHDCIENEGAITTSCICSVWGTWTYIVEFQCWPWSTARFIGCLLCSCVKASNSFRYSGPTSILVLLFWIFIFEAVNHSTLSTIFVQSWCYALWTVTIMPSPVWYCIPHLVVCSHLDLVKGFLVISHRPWRQRGICLSKCPTILWIQIGKSYLHLVMVWCDSGIIPGGDFQGAAQL